MTAVEIAKTCVNCSQQYSSHEAPGIVCMDCEWAYEDSGTPTCDRCGVGIGDFRAGTIRCADCRGRIAPVYADRQCANDRCASIFTPIKDGQRSCSNRCAQAVWKRKNRKAEPWDDRRRANYHKRRALKMALPSEDVRPLDVYERDGWICGLCRGPVDKNLAWPDPLSPSLDHVKPLSKGGHHVYSNTQLAHLTCNVSKGDRVTTP